LVLGEHGGVAYLRHAYLTYCIFYRRFAPAAQIFLCNLMAILPGVFRYSRFNIFPN